MRDILLINGPNLRRLGKRRPEIYGNTTLAEIEETVHLEALGRGLTVKTHQNDVEGELIRFIDENRYAAGLIINPGALMVGGWCLRDCLEDFDGYKVEVHISNIFSRERFRTKSVLADVMNAVIVGCGTYGYVLALAAQKRNLNDQEATLA